MHHRRLFWAVYSCDQLPVEWIGYPGIQPPVESDQRSSHGWRHQGTRDLGSYVILWQIQHYRLTMHTGYRLGDYSRLVRHHLFGSIRGLLCAWSFHPSLLFKWLCSIVTIVWAVLVLTPSTHGPHMIACKLRSFTRITSSVSCRHSSILSQTLSLWPVVISTKKNWIYIGSVVSDEVGQGR